jgi:hypothetical protein
VSTVNVQQFESMGKHLVFLVINNIDRYIEYICRLLNKIKSTVASKSTAPMVTVKQERQCTINATIRRGRATIVAVEKQTADIHKIYSQNVASRPKCLLHGCVQSSSEITLKGKNLRYNNMNVKLFLENSLVIQWPHHIFNGHTTNSMATPHIQWPHYIFNGHDTHSIATPHIQCPHHTFNVHTTHSMATPHIQWPHHTHSCLLHVYVIFSCGDLAIGQSHVQDFFARRVRRLFSSS